MRKNNFCKFALCAAGAFLLVLQAGCGGKNASGFGSGKKISVMATIFPQYDWAKNIIGDTKKIDLSLLMTSGVDLHSFQPSVADMVEISKSDVFIYVGGESDQWVPKALKNVKKPNFVTINLLEVLGEKAKVEDIVEGMQLDEEHEHDGSRAGAGRKPNWTEEEHFEAEEQHIADGAELDYEEHGHEGEYDEHVWLSLRNAEFFCNYLAAEFGRLDSENAAVYAENAQNYIARLRELDAEYKTSVAGAIRDTLLVCDRFPFRYLVDDYGLNYFAAFRGCSAETEASFETVAFLAGKAEELQAINVITIEGTVHKIAETVIASTAAKNQNVLVMDSMQAVTAKDIEAGTSYIDRMRQNLEVLKVALN